MATVAVVSGIARPSASSIEGRAAGAFLAADLALVSLDLTLTLLGHDVRLFSVAAERNIPTWYSSAKLLLLAQLLGLAVWFSPAPSRVARVASFAPTTLFLAMSLDETASVHERVESRAAEMLDGGVAAAAYWPHLTAVVLVAALAWVGIAFTRLTRPPAPVVAGAAAGSAVFLLGVVGLDTVHAAVKPGPSSATLWAAAEEGCEFVGVTLLIWAALRLVRHRAPMMVRRTTAA